jgi:VWFA-related protein
MKSIAYVFAACLLVQILVRHAPSDDPSTIRLEVVVESKHTVSPLTAADFTVFDNKKPVQITSFRAMTQDDPVEVLLLVDAINVPHSSIAYERQQIDDYLSANGGKLPQPVRIAIVTETGVKMQPASSRDGLLLKANFDEMVAPLRIIGHNAALPGAVERFQDSMKVLQAFVEREARRPGRKLLLWVSPGWPLLSGPALETSVREQNRIFAEVVRLSTSMRQAGITLYQLGPVPENVANLNFWRSFEKPISKPSQAEEGDLGLQVLAMQTGGLVMNDGNAIADFARRAVDDTRVYYEISFAAAKAQRADELHGIEVKVAQPGVSARTTRFYYAQP